MANIKISALPAASPITGVELLPIVQSATTKKTTINDVRAYILSGTSFIDGSGTANKIPVFTDANTITDSILTQNVNGKEVSLAVNTNSLIGMSVINADNTNGSSRARLSAIAGTVQGALLSIATAGVYVGTESNHRVSVMMQGTEYIGITTSGKVVINQAADTGENFIVGGSLRANGQITSTNVASAFRLLSGTDTLFSIGYTGGTLFDRLTGTNFFISENGSPQLTIASGGAATFNTSIVKINGADALLSVDGANKEWRLQTVDADGRLRIYNQTDGIEALAISSGGAALFTSGAGRPIAIKKSSVFTGSFYIEYLNSVGSSIGYLGYGSGGNDKFQVFNGLAASSLAAGSSVLEVGFNGAESSINTNFKITGNLGIGISPAYALHVYSIAASNARVYIQGGTNFVATNYENTGGAFYTGIDDSTGSNFTGTAYKRFLYSAGAYDFGIYTNGLEALKISSSGILSIIQPPATSAASYDILTRNTVTGVIEKVASSVLTGITGSGATGLIPVFTGATSIGNSIMSQSGSVLLINGEVRIVTVDEQPVGFYKTLVHDSTTNYVHEVAINSFERTPIADTNYTTSAQDNLIAYTALTAQRTVSLRPPATSLGTSERPVFVAVKDETGNANTHNIKVDVSGGGNIDGSPTQTISIAYGSIWFYCDGTKWSVYTRI